MKYLLLLITALLLVGCGQKKRDERIVQEYIEEMNARKEAKEAKEKEAEEKEAKESVEWADMAGDEIEVEQNEYALNDIRFDNWTEKDWLDNDYFRFLRTCFDDCIKGVENENTRQLQDYKSVLKDKFFVGSVEECIFGGMFITLGFLNRPEILYQTVVYSYVDEDTKKISGFGLRGFVGLEEPIDITKEDILRIAKEHPEHKLW